MYHDLLLVLLGYPGKWFSREENMIDHANFFNPSEKALVKQILGVAQEHYQLKQFIKDYGRHKTKLVPPEGVSTNGTPKNPGLYMQALCEGLDEALDCYRAGIEALEHTILKDPQCNLTHLLSFALKYKDFLSALNVIIHEIKVNQVHGCLLLQLLHNHSSTKFDGVKEAVTRMMQECHCVFFKQVTNWVLFGQVTDEFDEFFIKAVQKSNEEETESVEYELRPEMIPSYISPSLAHKILSVGQTILIIGRDPNEQCFEAAQSSRLVSGEGVWGECGQQYFQNLYSLHTSPVLDLELFDDTISLIKNCVTERLWVLAVEKADLHDQLRLIKDMFLLSRGELFHEFIQEARSVLDRPINKNFSREINQSFHSAAHKILVTSEEAKMDKFYFTFSTTECENGWSSLVLQYKADWPLHLLFSHSVLDSYNQLFGFLLRVKKTQMQLHHLWRDQMVNKSTNWRESSAWQIRSSLMFLVDNLQYYLQVDVLESQWSTLQAALKSTRDFENLRRAHAAFLASILSQTFLLLGVKQGEPNTTTYHNPESLKNNLVHKKLSDLLRLCEQFCNMVTIWGLHPSTQQSQELEPLCEELDNVMNTLLSLLSSLRSQPCGVHLAQLLLRLDFNRWFSLQRGVPSMTSSFI